MTDPRTGSDALDAYVAGSASDDPIAALGAFDDYFSSGCQTGAVSPLPRGADEARELPLVGERAAAVRDRLGRLGYPVSQDAKGSLSEVLVMFQHEAGLPEHGAIDATTWDALQALFAFEKPLRAEQWFDASGRPRPVLLRATRLRLSVLGFGAAPSDTGETPKPGSRRHGPHGTRHPRVAVAQETDWDDHSLLRRNLQALEGACGMMKIPTISIEDGWEFTPERAAWLFDHETLVGRLAGVDTTTISHLAASRREAAETLLICAAKVELWLFGYDVRPDGDPELGFRTRRGRPGAPPPVRRFDETKTARVMRDFLADIEPAAASVRLPYLAVELPRLFQQMLLLRERHAREVPRREGSAVILDTLMPSLEREPDLVGRLSRAASSFVGRLFDGLRRVFAWLGGLLKRTLSRVLDQALNLWRAVYHFSGAVAFRLRQAVDALSGGVEFLFSNRRESEPVGHALYARRMDFDLSVIIDLSAEADVVKNLGREMILGAAQLSVACRLIALAARSVRRIATRSSLGPIGYVSLLLGLGRVFSQVRDLGAGLDRLETLAA